jgi:hypothetical protein
VAAGAECDVPVRVPVEDALIGLVEGAWIVVRRAVTLALVSDVVPVQPLLIEFGARAPDFCW